MSCMGLDFGYQTAVIAVPKGGGIEVVLNDYSKRATPTCVSFGDKMRAIGESGKQRAVTAFKNTITYFKGLVGRKYEAPDVQEELSHAHFKHCAMPDGGVGVVVQHNGETHTLSVTQVLGMLLSHLRESAENDIGTKVESCVLGVPVYYNDAQRHALLDAVRIANLGCLRLINETSAVALNYGIYKGGLPEPTEAPRRVAFFDFGHSNLQLSLCEFVKGKLSVVTTASCRVGGRDFDLALLAEMAKRFQEKTKLDLMAKPRAAIRMEAECEKLKKMMSANTTDIPMNVECLMEDRDFSTKMKRAEFEELCAPLFDKVRATIASFIADVEARDISLKDLHSVEIVGGMSRVPLVKQMVAEAFGTTPQTTLNCDEAVSRGCGLMSAILSPMFRVRDFKIDETTPYGVNLTWAAASGSNGDEEEQQDSDSTSAIFTANGLANVTKLLTFFRTEDFEFSATYSDPEAVPDKPKQIGNFKIEGVKPSYDGEKQKVKVEVQMDGNGCLMVRSATLLDKVPPQEESKPAADASEGSDKKMDTSEDKADDAADSKSEEEPAAKKPETEESKDDKKSDKKEDKKEEKKEEKKKRKVKRVPLTVVTWKPCIKLESEMNELVEFEAQMAVQDLHEKEKHDARNALEEYIYEMRDKVTSVYEPFMTSQDCDAFRARLSEMEDWLYDEGEDQPKTVYNEKLKDLRVTGDEVKARAMDFETRPKAEEAMRQAIVHFRKFLDEHAAGDEKYAHISEEQVKKVADAVAEHEEWLNTKAAEQSNLPKSSPPVLTTAELENKTKELQRVCQPVLDTPKPKVEPPKEEEEAKKEGEESKEEPAADGAEGDNKKSEEAEKQKEQEQPSTTMEETD